jgi:hypothetical protein
MQSTCRKYPDGHGPDGPDGQRRAQLTNSEGRTAHIGLRANDFVGSTDRPMKTSRSLKVQGPGAVGLVIRSSYAGRRTLLPRFTMSILRASQCSPTIAMNRIRSGVERIAQVTRQTPAMPVEVPCTDESRAFSTREYAVCRAGWNTMTVLRSARACTTDASAFMKQGG